MRMTTMGLVLREIKTGESDRILHILTPQRGMITAIAKSSLRLKNKLFSATGLFCYSEFTLFSGKNMEIVDEAEVREMFLGIRSNVENMALAMYFAEIAMTLNPGEEEAEAQLRLLLNCFHMLSAGKREPKQIKPIYELRALSMAGYMPDLVACASCVKYDGGAFCFDTDAALLYCAQCAEERGFAPNLDPSALAALRHITYAPNEKLFGFALGETSLAQLYGAVGRYTQICIGKPLKTLEFLNTVLS